MGRVSKKLYWAGAAFLLVLLLALAVIVPRLVDSVWLRDTIQAEVTKQIKGDFAFQKAELSFLPSPSVSLHQAALSIPGTARANLDILKVYPKLLPLLLGNIAIAKVVVDTPDFSIHLPEESAKKKDPVKTFSFSDALDNSAAKLAPILSALQGMQAGIHKGTLRLFKGEKQAFLLENINGSFAAAGDSLTVAVRCRSNIWDSMELHGTIFPEAREGKGEISVKNIHAMVLADYFLPGKTPLSDGSVSSLQADITVSADTGLIADISTSGSTFSLLQEEKRITAAVENFKGSIRYSDQISAITVDTLVLSYPQVRLNGSFSFDQATPYAGLDIELQQADIKGVRTVLPVFVETFYGDLPVIREIFDITREGTVPEASFHVEGKSPADLGLFESMLIQARLKDGEILLSDLGLDLHGVTGEVSVAGGILEGRNLQAELGKSTGTGGTLKLDLVPKKSTKFHLDLDLDADLAEVPPLLKEIVSNKQIHEYLSLFETIAGTAQGRLTLGESLESLAVRIEANKISGQANFKPVPYPITISGGSIELDGLNTHSFNLQGKVGNSTFSNYSSRMNFEGEPTIEIQSGTFHFLLDEIFPWLASDPRLEDDLKDIKKMTGIAEVTVKSSSGPLLRPADLQYELQCDFKNIDLVAADLPGPLKVASGKAEIYPDKTIFQNIHANLLDSYIAVSGLLQNYINGKTSAEIIMTDTEIGPEVNAWISGQIKVPDEYVFRSPLQVSRSNVKWTREELLDLQGDFSIKDGPIFFIDVLLDPDALILRRLALKNGEENAEIKVALKKREISAEFQGSLSKNSIDGILLHNDLFPEAWIEGDIRFFFDLDSPAKTFASGKLDGGNFIFPWGLGKPFLLDSFSLSAADKKLTLNAAEAVFEGNKYVLNGEASLIREYLSMDLDVSTNNIELHPIISALHHDDKDKDGDQGRKGARKFSDLAVRANVNLHADSLRYDKFTWEPFESIVTYENSVLGIEVLKAELCNISTPGKISFHNGQTALDFYFEAEGEDFSKVLVCLEGGQKQITGLLDLKASIAGQGTQETLVKSLQGELNLSAEDGFIYQDAQAAKLLSFLNITSMFRDRIPDLRTAGFHYDSLLVQGTMDKGILSIDQAKLEAPIMQIAANGTIDIPAKKVNIQGLVAPLQTINKIQEMLPVIKHIVPSSLVAVPVDISGDFSDIRVQALSMSAIGTRVFDIMVDALSTPVRALGGPEK